MPACMSNALCQDATQNPLLLFFHLTAILAAPRPSDAHLSISVCLPRLLSCPLSGQTTQPSGSRPPRHGSSTCYSSVNLSRTTGTPALWHTSVLSRRREEGTLEGAYCTSHSLPERPKDQRAESSVVETWRTCGQTPPPLLYQPAITDDLGSPLDSTPSSCPLCSALLAPAL
ncbi:hypothetical protein EYF80_061590 [Liparis tanakae]|uniref:Uncharacterized protein n=1 Tax=Liparis tanakae TaxID=230148 RepID=A0A4Z2EIU1_9TELE|nr:hypothetical protein EYF80_061590 [Liparis tanakae]